jgi:hypothetical protein
MVALAPLRSRRFWSKSSFILFFCANWYRPSAVIAKS